MTVSKINAFFKKIGEAQVKYRWIFLCAFFILSLFCCAGLSKFKVVNGSDGWYGNMDKIKINKAKYEATFGNAHELAVLVCADDVFSEEILTVIKELGDRMMSIPYADKLTSLIEVDIPVGNDEGFEIVRPYEKGIPSDPKALKAKKDFILRGNEKTNSLINSLVSDDGKETWLMLTLLPYEGDADEEAAKAGQGLYDIIHDPHFQSDSYSLYGSGQPYSDLVDEIYEYPDFLLRVGLGFIVMLVFLMIFVRSPMGVIVPALSTVGAIATVLGLMAWCGEKADFTLITLPILLGMALSVGYSIHYINMFKLFFRRTGNRRQSVVATVEECGWSVFFTVLTTVASLISFAFVDMRPVSWMGRTASLVVLAVYAYVAVLVPIFYSFGKDRQADTSKEKGATKVDMKFSRWADVVQKKRKAIIIITILVFALCIPGILKIKVSVDYFKSSGLKMPHIQKTYELMNKKLGNQYSYQVMISFDQPDTFKDPEVMKKFSEFEKILSGLSLTKISGGKARISSVSDIIKEMNRALNEGQEDYYSIPEDDYILAQLMELSYIEMGKEFTQCMDDEFKTAAIGVDLSHYNESEAVQNVKVINKELERLFPDAECIILGDMIEFAEMSLRMASGEVKSLGFSFIIIAIMLILAFSSIRTGLISMIPNVAPVIIVAAIMGYCGFPLEFATVTVMPMILGIAVDDTIHLTTHLKYGLEKYGSYTASMESSFREIGKSMFMTTFILCTIFAVYMFSPLHYLFVIGLLSVAGLSAALIADYTITPALLYLVKPFGKEKSDEN